LQKSNKGKKNHINTTYKLTEVSVKLWAQLLGFEVNQSTNCKDVEITDMFALYLSVYEGLSKNSGICPFEKKIP
jgi:hypothetical protein